MTSNVLPHSTPKWSTVALCIVLLIASVHAQDDDTCLMTPTKCQCASTTPSGMCTRSQGDGTCIFGPCSAGYRCDCFGFEVCNVAKCSKFVPTGSADPNVKTPFRCERVAGNADCVTLDDVAETAESAKNAEADSAASNDKSTDAEADIVTELKMVQVQKKAVNQMLKDVDRLSDNVPDTEVDSIDEQAEKVEDTVVETTDLVVEVVKDAKKACKGLRQARKLKRRALRKNRDCKKRRKELKEEEKKPRRNEFRCKALRKEIEDLDNEKKKASRGCARKAQEVRQFMKKTKGRVRECKRVRQRGTFAFRGCMAKVKTCLGRAGARIPSYEGAV